MAAIDARHSLEAGGERYEIHRLSALGDEFDVGRLPYSMKVLLENLLRHNDGVRVTDDDVAAVARWDGRPADGGEREISFLPARVLMQDFTGVPAVVDLAAMRARRGRAGCRPRRARPADPGRPGHRPLGAGRRVRPARRAGPQRRARVRAQPRALPVPALGPAGVRPVLGGPPGHRHLPPGQPRVPRDCRGHRRDGWAFPDTLVGTDSHTPMVNGLGVLGWGVGGIEAEAALLGQPISMLVPRWWGSGSAGELPEGTTATDLVLTVTNMLRAKGVVGRFVEFYGPGVAERTPGEPGDHRQHVARVRVDVTIFPIDEETLRYLRFTGRDDAAVALVEAYAKEQGLLHDPAHRARLHRDVELDLGTVEPRSPGRPAHRIASPSARPRPASRCRCSTRSPRRGAGGHVGVDRPRHDDADAQSFPASDPPAAISDGPQADEPPGQRTPRPVRRGAGRPPRAGSGLLDATAGLDEEVEVTLDHGDVAIAAITSCTNVEPLGDGGGRARRPRRRPVASPAGRG